MMRYDLINHLIKTHNLNRYLEIGLQCKSNNYDRIVCKDKFSVDPDPNAEASFRTTSDEFFEIGKYDARQDFRFDIIFIDGLHHSDQVNKDFQNSLLCLPKFIVLHDCNPPEEQFTHVPRDSKIWFGDVYRFASRLGCNESFYTVDIDCGCGVYKITNEPLSLLPESPDWKTFHQNRKELLNLILWEEFLKREC